MKKNERIKGIMRSKCLYMLLMLIMIATAGFTQEEYPFPNPIDASTIPQFVDPMPHFAAGLRVNAKAGGNLLIKAVKVQQVSVSNGTPLPGLGGGAVANNIPSRGPLVGLGNYAAYAVSKDGGKTFGPAMWPAQTIEAKQDNQLIVQYRNDLFGVHYSDFNILADQTLMMNGYDLNGNPQIDPYTGDIPMSVHLHGGEMPSNSDGGPTAWFTPGYNKQGPGFAHEASSLCTYPNKQEGTTLWYHPHDQGLTRINVYTGLAGYYFLRGTNEDNLRLPGWSGDGKVMEVTPAGKNPTFNGTNTYLPEIELAIQDRMFNEKGELYWPVEPTNPEVNPFWTPEFFGDVMTVNGRTWPYLSVAPRKYMFRMLDGCNARFLNLWLSSNPTTGVKDGPKITVLSTEGGFLDAPVPKDPKLNQTLFLAPAERPMVIIDFTGYKKGTVFYLMNDAQAPYPSGDAPITGLTDRIMQFVVNGVAISGDKSVIPTNLRPGHQIVKLTDFAGKQNLKPVIKRQLLLNEITTGDDGGPLRVAINNSHFDAITPSPTEPFSFGGPTEMPTEGTTEVWQIINTTADAHPMHPHLVQFQLVSRQAFNTEAYMAAYSAAWATHDPAIPNFPASASYPGGAGSPYPYNTLNADSAVGGNPAVSTFLSGPVFPALPEERGWKDAIKSLPDQVETYIVRFAPTEKPLKASPLDLVFPFDPSKGPGYVWHCHIIDHEDMDMMRPLMVQPATVRFPVITKQPDNLSLCLGFDAATFKVDAFSLNKISYQWQVSSDEGKVWKNLTNGILYKNVLTSEMKIALVPISLNNFKYRCKLSTIVGDVYSEAATLKVSPRPIVLIIPNYSDKSTLILKSLTIPQGDYTYLWTPGNSTTQNITLNNRNSGLYSVTATNTYGCSSFPAFYVVKWINPGLKSGLLTEPSAITPTALGTNLNVYPNPFTDKLNFEFSFESDTHAVLEIFNVAGVKLATLYDENINGGQLYTIEYLPHLTNSQTVIYRLSLGDKSYTGKLIYQQK